MLSVHGQLSFERRKAVARQKFAFFVSLIVLVIFVIGCKPKVTPVPTPTLVPTVKATMTLAPTLTATSTLTPTIAPTNTITPTATLKPTTVVTATIVTSGKLVLNPTKVATESEEKPTEKPVVKATVKATVKPKATPTDVVEEPTEEPSSSWTEVFTNKLLKATTDFPANYSDSKVSTSFVKEDGFKLSVGTSYFQPLVVSVAGEFVNCKIEVNVKFLSEVKINSGGGIVTNFSNNNYYMFMVNGKGEWGILKYAKKAKEVLSVVKEGSSSSVKKGLNVVNRLRVDIIDGGYSFYVNDKEIDSGELDYLTGYTGIIACNRDAEDAETTAEVVFSDISISE